MLIIKKSRPYKAEYLFVTEQQVSSMNFEETNLRIYFGNKTEYIDIKFEKEIENKSEAIKIILKIIKTNSELNEIINLNELEKIIIEGVLKNEIN